MNKGKYSEVISKARNAESTNASIPESQIPEKDVNLSIKVPKALRRHWSVEAKRQDTSLTAAITEALIARFGTPSGTEDA